VKEPRSDDERLAALLDGRLEGREREELLEHLSVSADDRRVVTDTAAILRELEAAEAGEGVIPLRTRPAARRWRVHSGWGAMAAVLVGVVLLAALWSRGRASGAADPVRLASRVEPRAGLPDGWTGRPAWDPARGDAPGERSAQAARAGALLVDLAVSVEARDAAGTRLLAERVRSRFDPRAGAAGPLRQLALRAGAPADSLRPLVESATERLARRLGEEPLRLGAWAEASRLAAHRRDEGFFTARGSRAMLRRAERNPASRAAAARVRAAIPAQGPPDWDALSAALDALLRDLAT
jgi:hypothetical protein